MRTVIAPSSRLADRATFRGWGFELRVWDQVSFFQCLFHFHFYLLFSPCLFIFIIVFSLIYSPFFIVHYSLWGLSIRLANRATQDSQGQILALT